MPLRYTHYLNQPLLRPEILKHPVLSQMSVIRAPQGTNFRVSLQEWQALQELLGMDKWDDFIFWARKFREWPGFDADERDYKLNLAKRLAAARDLFRSGDEGWVGALRGALTSKDNNFTNWRVHSPFIHWMESSSVEAGEAVGHLWTTPGPVRDSVEAFAERVQLPTKAAKSGLITLASVLLGGVDMPGLPPYPQGGVLQGIRPDGVFRTGRRCRLW